MTWLLVALAGAGGALARYGLVLVTGPRAFPGTILTINVSGSFLLALVLTVAAGGRLSPQTAVVVGTGFLGAYTTYSTFSWDVLSLIRDNRWGTASLYVASTLILGLAATWLGYQAGLALRD